jgi:hypothetical protein
LQQTVANSVEREHVVLRSALLPQKPVQVRHGTGPELDLQQKLRRGPARCPAHPSFVHDETDLLVRGSEDADISGVFADRAMNVGDR